jgi:hypothetical protein
MLFVEKKKRVEIDYRYNTILTIDVPLKDERS